MPLFLFFCNLLFFYLYINIPGVEIFARYNIMNYEKNIKIFVYHNCFKLYPYYKSTWNKEYKRMEGTCPKLDNQFLVFDQYQGFINKKDILHCFM